MNLDQIARDIRYIATHVANQPRGYAPFESNRAKVLLERVDMEALRKTLNSVLFVSTYRHYQPLNPVELAAYHVALRLDGLLQTIEKHKDAISKQLVA